MRRTDGKIRKTDSKRRHYQLREGDQRNVAPMGVTIMVDPNPEVRRMLNATTVVRKDMSRKSIGVTRREKRAKNLSHQMLRGV